MKFKQKNAFIAIALLIGLLFGATTQVFAKHNKAHIQQCLRAAQLAFFKEVDRALTTYWQRKKDCRNHITTVDNYLRCLNSAKSRYDQAIAAAKRRYFSARLRCTGYRVWKGKDLILIPRHQLKLRKLPSK